MSSRPTYEELEQRIRELEKDSDEFGRTRKALDESQGITERIINAIPVRVFWKDESLVYLGCNNIFARDAGFEDSKDVVGKDDYQMAWLDQADLYRADDRQVIESGLAKLLIEEPQTTPDGKEITLLTSKIPLRDSDGKIYGVLGTYMDITERKRMEDALATEHRQLQLALDDIKTLRGILPICSYCKQIRDDEGYWNEVETYISAHTDALFSHGICPVCREKNFPRSTAATKRDPSA